ncbi:MAG: hypothetical protein RI842_10395 [Schleiferiaceae bacterium]|nr:hypothetical protein [Schleiferiaceae bacterium]MDR9443117.1 hypothetical protein [Schleiferiaceae bacterium]
MILYFGTVRRGAPLAEGGEIVKLDWQRKEVLARQPIVPRQPDVSHDPNPRGRTRGCRGIQYAKGRLVAANYHSLEVFDRDLNRMDTVSNGMMVGLHELDRDQDENLWLTSTAIDAAVKVDPLSGEILEKVLPREREAFRASFGLASLPLDKEGDNRDKFLAIKPKEDPGHVHLNAVKMQGGNLYALFNRFGALVNLSEEKVVLQDARIKGAHNIAFVDQGMVAINDSVRAKIRFFDLATGELSGSINLKNKAPLLKHTGYARLRYRGEQVLRKMNLMNAPVLAKPLFVRGLAKQGNRLFVGASPGMILCFDWRSGKLVDYFVYEGDTRVAIHGLQCLEE